MILGAAKWADRDTWFSQVNNALETELRKLGVVHWLQSCGASAAATCAAAVGYDVTITAPGGWIMQADQIINDYLNDPGNYIKMQAVAPELDPSLDPGNRHAPYYPLAAREVLGAQAIYLYPFHAQTMADHLRRGRAIQVCINPPGHYLAVVAWDAATGEYIYNDPWPGRPRVPAADGFNTRMTTAEYNSIVAEAVLWCPPGDKGE